MTHKTYKIRINLNSKETIFRDVEIKEKQNLWNLHLGVKSAFSLMGEELSSFYFSDNQWEEGRAIPLEDMSDSGEEEIMSDIYLSEAFAEIGDKMLYRYGFIDLWEFACELIEINQEKPSVNYPITIYRFGNMPIKAPKNLGRSSSDLFLADDFQENFEEIKMDSYDDDDQESDDDYDPYDDQDYHDED